LRFFDLNLFCAKYIISFK